LIWLLSIPPDQLSASLCLIWPWWQCSIHKWFKKAERGEIGGREGQGDGIVMHERALKIE